MDDLLGRVDGLRHRVEELHTPTPTEGLIIEDFLASGARGDSVRVMQSELEATKAENYQLRAEALMRDAPARTPSRNGFPPAFPGTQPTLATTPVRARFVRGDPTPATPSFWSAP